MPEDNLNCPQCKTHNPLTNNYCLACGALLKTSLVTADQKCPFCFAVINLTDIFCPHCSKKLKEKPLSSSIWKQIGIYLLSFFLPPLGFWPAFKYLHQTDSKLKKIGYIAVILTVISIVVTLYFTVNLVGQVNTQINSELRNFNYY